MIRIATLLCSVLAMLLCGPVAVRAQEQPAAAPAQPETPPASGNLDLMWTGSLSSVSIDGVTYPPRSRLESVAAGRHSLVAVFADGRQAQHDFVIDPNATTQLRLEPGVVSLAPAPSPEPMIPFAAPAPVAPAPSKRTLPPFVLKAMGWPWAVPPTVVAGLSLLTAFVFWTSPAGSLPLYGKLPFDASRQAYQALGATFAGMALLSVALAVVAIAVPYVAERTVQATDL